MRGNPRYRAFWLPGLNEDQADSDDVLDLAFRWLRSERAPGGRIVVMNAVKMIHNRRQLPDLAAGLELLSPRSRTRPHGQGERAVLAIWPTQGTLSFAEDLAARGALCVVPGSINDMAPWINRTAAESLWHAEIDIPSLVELDEAVRECLDSVVAFDGHNDFLGAGGKEHAIRRLRVMIHEGFRPAPLEVESYVLASGDLRSERGAIRLRDWYEGLLDGKRFRDYAGRSI